MSTMLADMVEQGNGLGGSDVDTSDAARLDGFGGADLQQELRRWRDEVLTALRDTRATVDVPVDDTDGSCCRTSAALNQLKEAIGVDGTELLRRAEQFVAEHPWKALGIAGGTGLLLSVAWSR